MPATPFLVTMKPSVPIEPDHIDIYTFNLQQTPPMGLLGGVSGFPAACSITQEEEEDYRQQLLRI
jgi:hypothetical protein